MTSMLDKLAAKTAETLNDNKDDKPAVQKPVKTVKRYMCYTPGMRFMIGGELIKSDVNGFLPNPTDKQKERYDLLVKRGDFVLVDVVEE